MMKHPPKTAFLYVYATGEMIDKISGEVLGLAPRRFAFAGYETREDYDNAAR